MLIIRPDDSSGGGVGGNSLHNEKHSELGFPLILYISRK